MVVALLSNLRRIIGENSDLRPTVFKEHDAAATFGREDDPFANKAFGASAHGLQDLLSPLRLAPRHAVCVTRVSASCYPLLLWTFTIYALRILPAH